MQEKTLQMKPINNNKTVIAEKIATLNGKAIISFMVEALPYRPT